VLADSPLVCIRCDRGIADEGGHVDQASGSHRLPHLFRRLFKQRDIRRVNVDQAIDARLIDDLVQSAHT